MTPKTLASLAAGSALLAAVLGQACGAYKTPSNPGADAGPTGDVACADLGKARCQKRGDCSNVNLQVAYGDETTCETREKLGCTENLSLSGTSWTPPLFDACATAVPGETCDDFFSGNAPTACLAPPGPAANGAACAANSQCQSDFCAISAGTPCGTCQAMPKAGDSCALYGCGREGLVCAGPNRVCQVPKAVNETCDRSYPCAFGLSCVGAGVGNGTCQLAANTVGAKCDPRQQTAPGCETRLGLYCNPPTGTCALATVAAAGQPCGVVAGAGVVCARSGVCRLGPGPDGGPSRTGICIAAAGDGEACDEAAGPGCLPPARCIVSGADGGSGGTCLLLSQMGCH